MFGLIHISHIGSYNQLVIIYGAGPKPIRIKVTTQPAHIPKSIIKVHSSPFRNYFAGVPQLVLQPSYFQSSEEVEVGEGVPSEELI